MKKLLAFLFFSYFFLLRSFSQEKLIVCNWELNSDKSYSIYADSRAFAEYTVKLNFQVLTGYSIPGYSGYTGTGYFKTIGTGKTQIAKLTPSTTSTNSFSYTYSYFPGRMLNRTPDTSFTYLLPAMPGSTLRTFTVTSLEARLGQKRTEEFHSVGFSYKMGDTICASRAGTVYETKDEATEGERRMQSYSTNRNSIAIEQRDGTIARYTFVAPIKLLVSPGDVVRPGQPLAFFDKESEKYEIFVDVYYLDQRRLTDGYMNPDHPEKTAYYISVPINFFTAADGAPLQARSTYVVTHPVNIIGAELSKREKKRLGL